METPAAWHVLMPSRATRTSYPGSDSGTGRRPGENVAIFQPDGTVNAQIAEKAASIFWSYDTDSKGSLDRGDLVCALSDMGALQNLPAKMIGDILNLDAVGNQDRRYTLHEFLTMYMRLAQQQAKLIREGRSKVICQSPEPPPGAENNLALRQVFGAYCQFARGTSRMMMSDTSPAMVAQQLHRLSQDIGLIGEGGPLYSSSVDIAYVRCQTPGSHRLNFMQWLKAIAILSEESGWDLFRLLVEFAYNLGTKGLPAPVDPNTMLPPKPGMVIPALPQLRQSFNNNINAPLEPPFRQMANGNGNVNGNGNNGNSNGGQDMDGVSTLRQSQSLMAPSNGIPSGRVRPYSSSSQRLPRFNNLMASSNGPRRDYSSPGDFGLGMEQQPEPAARPGPGDKGWTAFDLAQLDPSCLPPWLAQLLDRLQFIEAQAQGERRTHGGRGPRAAAEEQDAMLDTVQSLGQRLQAAEAAAAASAAACLGAVPPAGSEMSTALAGLPPWLQQGGGRPSATNRQLQDMVQDLERALQSQRDEADATMRRLQQLESKVAAGAMMAGSERGGGGGPPPGSNWEDRLRRCEIRLDGHDTQLARGAMVQGGGGGGNGSNGGGGQAQPHDSRLSDVEHHMKTYSVSLLATATSAASAGECAAAASERSRQAEAVASAAAARLEQLERRLQERGLVHEPGSYEELQAAAAVQAAPTPQQMVSMGLDPKVADQLAKLPGLGLDALVWAEILKRLGRAEQQARDVEGKLGELMQGPMLAAAAAGQQTAAGGRPSAAAQQMLDDGLDPRVVEQLCKLSAIGVDPGVIADLFKRQGSTEQEVKKLRDSPAAAAAAAAAGQQAAGGKPGAAEQQMLDDGLDPRVAEQLSKLSAIGVDPGVIADLIKRQGNTEQEVKRILENPAEAAASKQAAGRAASAGAGRAKSANGKGKAAAAGAGGEEAEAGAGRKAGGAAAGAGGASKQSAGGGYTDFPGFPSPAEQKMLDAGLAPKDVQQLGKLSALGVDPGVIADLIKRQDNTEHEMRKVLDGQRVGDAAAAGAAGAAAQDGAAAKAKRRAALQQMLDAGIDEALAEQLSRLADVGVDPLVFAGMLKRLAELEGEVKRLGLMRQQLDDARKSDIDQMNDVLAALQQDNVDTRQLASEAAAAGGAAADAAVDAQQRAEALGAFAEALAAKHDMLEGEVRGMKEAAAAGAAGPDGSAGADGRAADSEQLKELREELKQLANALGEVSGRCTAMERDLAMALTSYASILDLKESENHVLDRHQQLHDEIETLKENVRTVHDEVEQLTTAMVVAVPSIANSQHLPGVVKQSVHMGPGGLTNGSPRSGKLQTMPSREMA